jgi:hypothetical protein
MDLGLKWIRRRQRSLSKAVLAWFCLAWLQLAAVPCVTAHGDTSSMTVAPSGTAGVATHHGPSTVHGGDASDHCPYCPATEHCPPSGDAAGDCAYPHGPQVDARQAAPVFVPLVTACVPWTIEPTAPVPAAYERPALRPPSRIPVSVSYCRFIE